MLTQMKAGDSASSSHCIMPAAASHVMLPGRDEYSKATQTIETAFVPCEGCFIVQRSLRDAASVIVTACEMLQLTSHLARHQTTVGGIDWLSGTN